MEASGAFVVGGRIRRLAARTMAKQFAEQADGATHPFQYALSTKAGTECVAHIVQALTSMGENAFLLSIDEVGAYDSISRRAMFRGLSDMVDGAWVGGLLGCAAARSFGCSFLDGPMASGAEGALVATNRHVLAPSCPHDHS